MMYHLNFISKRKTKSLIGFLLLIALSVVVSCDKDDDEPTENSPVLNLIEPATTDFQIGPGEPFTLSVTASSNANSNASLTLFKVERNFNDSGYETVIDSVINTNQFELQGYQCQAANGFGTEDWKISIQDADGETNSITLNTTIESNAPAVQFLTGEYQPGMNYVADDITLVINQPFAFGISAIAVPGIKPQKYSYRSGI